MPEKWACCAAADVPRERTRGITMSPAAPTSFACAACAAARLGLCAPRANDHRNAGFYQLANPFLSVLVGEQWSIAHRTATHDGAHADLDQFTAFGDKSVKIGRAVRQRGCHESGSAPTETCASRVMRFRSSEYSYKSIRVSSPNQRPGMGTPMTASYCSTKRLRALTRTMP